MNKNIARIKRAKKTRYKFKQLKVTRLVVYRSLRHIYAQIILSNSKVLTSASTLEKQIIKITNNKNNVYSASIIGKIIAERALKKGIIIIAFDRSGYKYHGKIRALAKAARKTGLKF